MKRYYFIFVCLWVGHTLAWAQVKFDVKQEKMFGGKSDETLLDVAHSVDGGLLCLGNKRSALNGSIDGLLVKFNKQGKVLFAEHIGSDGDDQAHSVLQVPTGEIMVFGATLPTDSKNGKQKSAYWLKARSPEGDALWEANLNDSKNTATYFDMTYLATYHQLLLIGKSNDAMVLHTFDATTGTSLQYKTFPTGIKNLDIAELQLVAYPDDEQWIAYGLNQLYEGRLVPFFISLHRQSGVTGFIEFPDVPAQAIGNACLTAEKQLVATGTYKKTNDPTAENVFFLRATVPLNKKTAVVKEFSGRGFDEGVDILPVSENLFYLLENTTSFGSGAKTTDIGIFPIDKNGKALADEPVFIGGSLSERAAKFIRLPSGELFVCGTKDNGNPFTENQNFWVVEFKGGTKNKHTGKAQPAPAPTAPKPALATLPTQQPTPALSANTRSHKTYTLSNFADNGSLNVRCVTCEPNFKTLSGITITPENSKNLVVPFWAEGTLNGSDNIIELSVVDDNNKVVFTRLDTIHTLKTKKPAWQLATQTLSCPDNTCAKGQTILCNYTLVNIGDTTTYTPQVIFKLPEGVSYASNPHVRLPPVAAGNTYTGTFAFTPPVSYAPSQCNISLLVIDSVYFKEDYYFTIPVTLQEQNLLTVSPTLEKKWVSTAVTPQSPSATVTLPKVPVANAPASTSGTTPPTADGSHTGMQEGGIRLAISWNFDDSKSENLELTQINQNFEISVIAFSTAELSAKSFRILLNQDTIIIEGTKMDEVTLKTKKEPKRYKTFFSTQVPLRLGENTIAVLVKNEHGTDVTLPITVHYNGYDKGTLYLLSVGVPDRLQQLRYTTQDATDFARLFEQQRGKLFGAVESVVLTSAEETRADAITEQINKFKLLHKRQLLSNKDAVVLFVSSHGVLNAHDEFLLKASNYSVDNQKKTAINYAEDIAAVLDSLPCKKIVFLDACHSGAVNPIYTGNKDASDYSYSDALNTLAQAANNTRTITSCGAGEFSYEDDAWQNGAFTYVLENTLTNPNLCKQLDTNADRTLSVSELFGHLQKKVNELVKSNRKQTQTPYMPLLKATDDVPFFVY